MQTVNPLHDTTRLCARCLTARLLSTSPHLSPLISPPQSAISAPPSRTLFTSALPRPRNLSTITSLPASQSLPPSPPTAAYAPLPTRRLISLTGVDASHYLQGLTTSNIPTTPAGVRGFYSAFLNAQGRVLNDVFVYGFGGGVEEGLFGGTGGEEGWLIEVDAEDVEALAQRLKRYKLRAKVGIRVLSEGEVGLWSLWGDGVDGGGGRGLGCKDTRAPGMGHRLVLPSDKKPEIDAEMVPEPVYRIRRMMNGVPEGQHEILREVALPAESCLDYMGAVDFRKGCYVGQELTIRTHHTGVVRKRILPCVLYREGEDVPTVVAYDREWQGGVPEGGMALKREGRGAGKWIKGVGNLGLALCRLDAVREAVVRVEGVEGVRLRAFVPGWHGDLERAKRERIE